MCALSPVVRAHAPPGSAFGGRLRLRAVQTKGAVLFFEKTLVVWFFSPCPFILCALHEGLWPYTCHVSGPVWFFAVWLQVIKGESETWFGLRLECSFHLCTSGNCKRRLSGTPSMVYAARVSTRL